MQGFKRGRKVWIWGLFFLLVLLSLSSTAGKKASWNPFEQLVIEMTSPFQGFIKKTVTFTENVWLKYFYLINVRNENIHLRRQIESLEIENYGYRESLITQERLQELLQFKSTIHWPVLAAQVIGWDPTGWFKSVIIDKGKSSGLKVNMPVVNSEGVVGRLVSVSPNYAKVLLIIDQNSAVDCLIQRSRDKGIVKGLSSRIAKLDYVLKTSDVATGDRVVTSGFGRVFPKGIPVGEVKDVSNRPGGLFKEVKVTLSVNFSKLEEVMVILKEDPLVSNQQEKE
ncbi:MAG: rod shape-determining protein MreC [Pseudomonadota bacterium]